MIRVLALTQFAFLVLGAVAHQIMAKSDGSAKVNSLPVVGTHVWWLFLIPPVWMAFGGLCQRVNKPPLVPSVAQAAGVVLAVLCFLFMVSVTFEFIG